MSRSLNNPRCLLLLSALTAALLWLAPARSGRAAVYTYNARQRTINAGVLFAGSAADLARYDSTANGSFVPDPAPYLFRVLDLRPDVKPVGWSFVNPLAPASVTTAINTRWAKAYTAGAAVMPNMAAYWEVPLRDVSADDLQQFDVLYLTGSYLLAGQTKAIPITLTPSDNEKLRRFVDNGGQLIVEYGVGATNPPNFIGAALPLFDAATWADGPVTSALTFPNASGLHPLITQPNFLLAGDLASLGAPDLNNNFGVITQPPSPTGGPISIFGTVLIQGGTNDAVEAAQLGAGEIVTSALNIGPTISISQAAYFGVAPFFAQAPYVTAGSPPYGPASVPVSNLKFLSNILSWADTHPTENKTSHQNAAGPSSASFAAAWSKPVSNSAPNPQPGPPGAAIWGNYVYVTDAAGVLHAFDAIPEEFLTAGATADDGIPDFISKTAAPSTPYDEIWNATVGARASAPTVASFNNIAYVFVERVDGSVLQFNAAGSVASAPVVNTLTPPAPTNGGATAFPFGTNAPAPTYYDGRIYAGQPDGELFIYSLNGQGSAAGGVTIPVNPGNINNATPENATAAPAVGLLGAGTITNNIIALVPTNQNMNTVLLGGRNDPLTSYSTNGQFVGYNVNRFTRYRLNALFVDPASAPAGQAYDGNGGNRIPISGGQDPVFADTNPPANADDFYGDWDVDFRASTGQVNGGGGNVQAGLTLHEIKALSIANTGTAVSMSAPAIDRHGDYYYTVYEPATGDSYLFGVHDDVQQRSVLVKFRFRMPKMGDNSAKDANNNPWNNIDADNVHYDGSGNNGQSPATNPNGATNSLLDYRFVGAPVVDAQGNVYVAAQKSGFAAVLCFNANQVIIAQPTGAAGFDATAASYSQLDEFDGTTQNAIASRPLNAQGGRNGQITTTLTQATVFNFARGSGGARQIAGNLCEPQPFTGSMSANGASPTTATMNFHTNLAWYATFAVNGTVSGLSKAGNTLMLCDSGAGSSTSYNTLYKLPAAPTIGSGKVAALTVLKSPLGTDVSGNFLNVGTVTAAPSAGGGAMVINGAGGIAAFNQQLTLIADNNRILEVDADGKAVWSADATTRSQGANGLATKVDFAHPSALAQFAPNDYLVADTGNNRCVRFDRGGGVIWELTRFYDPSALMAPGQPNSLSQPSSVEVRREDGPGYTDPSTGKAAVSQFIHYLVADSGNDRIVEITDTLDASGNVLYFDTNTPAQVVAPGTANSVTHNHLLTWVTHTGDKYGRRYHYVGASYLNVPDTSGGSTLEIFALVTNARIAQPTPVLPVPAPPLLPQYALAPASSDAPGGSIIAFNRPATVVSPNGNIPKPFSQLRPNDNDISYVATSLTATTASGTQTYAVRNPRFLHVFAPPQETPASGSPYKYSFLYADDNGAFDLVYTGLTTPPASYGLALTQALYQSMTTPADLQGNVPLRGGVPTSTPPVPPIPFVPTCVQRLNNDATNNPGTNPTHLERYLITQSYSQGELGRQPGTPATVATRLGGEIFEVDVYTPAGGAPTIISVGGFGGGLQGVGTPLVFNGPLIGFTLSHPSGTSPLTQPTYAIRTTQ